MSKFRPFRVTNADYVNSYYRALLDQEKSGRLSFFNSNILPILKTADCIGQLYEVKFIALSTENWWVTPFIGGLMFQNKDDTKTLNRLHRTLGNSQLQIHVSPTQPSTLSSKSRIHE